MPLDKVLFSDHNGRMKLAVLALFALGCSASYEEQWCSTHRCEEVRTFDPAPELEAYTAANIDRLSRATGTEVLAEEAGGVPIVFQEALLTDGREDCAQTEAMTIGGPLYTQIIRLDPTPPRGCPPVNVTLLHEMIHALAPGVQHAAHGIFAKVAGGSKLDTDALVQLCSMFDCQEMVPE
jgi:hypothetical protein